MALIPGQGAKIPKAVPHNQKIKKMSENYQRKTTKKSLKRTNKWGYKYLLKFLFSVILNLYLEVELLGHLVILGLPW